MAKAQGPNIDISLARAVGAFYQCTSKVLNDEKAAQLDSEIYDAIEDLHESLKRFENFIATRKFSMFFRDRVVKFNGEDIIGPIH